MICNPGDVVLVRFMFTDQVGAKRRPAIILSVDAYQQSRPDIVMMPLTSQTPGDFGDAPVADWQAAGLLRPSHFKAVIQTIEHGTIDRRLGRLGDRDITRVKNVVRSIIDLS